MNVATNAIYAETKEGGRKKSCKQKHNTEMVDWSFDNFNKSKSETTRKREK